MPPGIELALHVGTSMGDLVRSRGSAPAIRPHLVEEPEVRAAYKRFRDLPQKAAYRQHLVGRLDEHWQDPRTRERFEKLAARLEEDGSLVFGALLGTRGFENLIGKYNSTLGRFGSQSFLHAYVNLANHPDFLRDAGINDAFMHPLVVALIAHRMGGPIRMVDARGKDAEPISVLAQDNMLHIDNTPFNDEYKIILAWKKNEPVGPAGQNFVFLPGTHKGVRACMVGAMGQAWSTENASIFTSTQSIEQVFDFQRKVTGKDATVIEAQHADKPLTIAFAAGSLVHHRYRTTEGSARSCMILAFHRMQDNPGGLVAGQATPEGGLADIMLGAAGPRSGARFDDALVRGAEKIEAMVTELFDTEAAPEWVTPKRFALAGDKLAAWQEAATVAPSVGAVKTQREVKLSAPGERMPLELVMARLGEVMRYDKHGPLDLILYADSHEESRKWARNRIREMQPEVLQSRLAEWRDDVVQPSSAHLLEPQALRDLADALATHIQDLPAHQKAAGRLDPAETLGPQDAYASLAQLASDLGESIVRCESLAAFASTSLFLFWCVDEALKMGPPDAARALRPLGRKLLNNYVATALLVEQQP